MNTFTVGDATTDYGATHINVTLFRDGSGNLYGTTHNGGGDNYGVVFKLLTNGKEKVLHSFTGFSDGGNLFARRIAV